jgi:hypothetical protein
VEFADGPARTGPRDLEPLLVDDEFALLGLPRGSAPRCPTRLAAEAYAVRIDDPLQTTFVLREALADTLPPAGRCGAGAAARDRARQRAAPDLTGFMSVIAGALRRAATFPIVPIGRRVPRPRARAGRALARGARHPARPARRLPPPPPQRLMDALRDALAEPGASTARARPPGRRRRLVAARRHAGDAARPASA